MKAMYTKEYENFRNLLLKARRDSGLTQAQVADRLSRPQSFVSKYERGERRLDVIEFLQVTGAVNCDPTEILNTLSHP